jgi:radical SAM-linked protein
MGARFDGWTENFDFELWMKAFDECGIDPDEYLRGRSFSDHLPWNHIEVQQSIKHLMKERNRTSKLLSETKKPEPEMEERAKKEDNDESMFGRGKKRVPASSALAAPTKTRVRVRWGRQGLVRFLSHLDNVRVFERAIRRSDIPIEYSQGFHPHMKLSFGPPLQLGYSSEAEYFDMTLDQPFRPDMADRLNAEMPDGFLIYEARPNYTGKKVSISGKLNRAVYEIVVDGGFDYSVAIEKLMARESIEIKRESKKEVKTIDIRPAIYFLEQRKSKESDDTIIYMELGVGEAGYVKPTELLGVMELPDEIDIGALVIHRKELLYIDEEKNRLTPMEF